MSDRHFFEWFESNNPDIPKGTEVTAHRDLKSDQLIVTYDINGMKFKRCFNVDVVNEVVIYNEVGMSNLFERNEPSASHKEAMELTKEPYVLLPALKEGKRYELRQLSDDSFIVLIVDE